MLEDEAYQKARKTMDILIRDGAAQDIGKLAEAIQKYLNAHASFECARSDLRATRKLVLQNNHMTDM